MNNNKFDNSPNTGRSMMDFKMRNQNPHIYFNKDEDNSRGYFRGVEIQDFGTSIMQLVPRTPMGNTPMSNYRHYPDEEADMSKIFSGTSRAMLGESSYRKKEVKASPMVSSVKRENAYHENKDLNFAQAAFKASNTSPLCPCCSQTLPKDGRVINWNYDKSWKVVNNDKNKIGALSPATGKFPINESQESKSPNPIISLNSCGSDRESKNKSKRKRKTKMQIKKLEDEFDKNPHWTNEDVERISHDLKLDKSQVYKWNWDQKKKKNILPSKVYVVTMPENMNQPSGTTQILNDNMTKVVYLKSTNDLQNFKNIKDGKMM